MFFSNHRWGALRSHGERGRTGLGGTGLGGELKSRVPGWDGFGLGLIFCGAKMRWYVDDEIAFSFGGLGGELGCKAEYSFYFLR